MSFTTINPSEITTGEPVAATTQNKIKGNLDDHESRLQSLEGGATTTYPPLLFRVNGAYDVGGARDGVLKTTCNFPIVITGVRLIIDKAGNTGTTEIDIKYKRGAGSWTSILTTKPSATAANGNDYVSTNAVINGSQATLTAGDLIRLDLTSVQNLGEGFMVRIDYARA